MGRHLSLPLLLSTVLFGCAWANISYAQSSPPAPVEAGVQPIGYLPPLQEGVVRLLLRNLSSPGEDGIPNNDPPTARIHVGTMQIGCDGPKCDAGGVPASSTPLEVIDSLHLGLVIDDTLMLGRGRSLSNEICDTLQLLNPPQTSYSAWRIGDSTGAASLGDKGQDVAGLCEQLDVLTGFDRKARSPIFHIIEEALTTMASDTQSGTRRELLVITDGEDETCIGAEDEDRCVEERIQHIVHLARSNSIQISVLLVDATRAAKRVPLHVGTRMRKLGANTGGVVRSIPLKAKSSSFTDLLEAHINAIRSVAYVNVECLVTPPEDQGIDYRVSVLQDGAVASIASRLLTAEPALCNTQTQLCELSGICAVHGGEIIRNIQHRQAETLPQPDDTIASNTQDASYDEPNDDSNLIQWIFLGLGVLFLVLGLTRLIRSKNRRNTSVHSAAAPTTENDISSTLSIDSSPRNDIGSHTTPTADLAPPVAPTPAARSLSSLGKLRKMRTNIAAPHLIGQNARGDVKSIRLAVDEWTRIFVDPQLGPAIATTGHYQLLLRCDSGTRLVAVHSGNIDNEISLFANRQVVPSQGMNIALGDTLHVTQHRIPLELRSGDAGVVFNATLLPEGAESLPLPEIELSYDETVIGRDAEALPGWEYEFQTSIRLPLDSLPDEARRKVSNDHCVVWISNGVPMIRDISSNGTWVNGVRIPRFMICELHDGDQIQFSNEISYRVKAQS